MKRKRDIGDGKEMKRDTEMIDDVREVRGESIDVKKEEREVEPEVRLEGGMTEVEIEVRMPQNAEDHEIVRMMKGEDDQEVLIGSKEGIVKEVRENDDTTRIEAAEGRIFADVQYSSHTKRCTYH